MRIGRGVDLGLGDVSSPPPGTGEAVAVLADVATGEVVGLVAPWVVGLVVPDPPRGVVAAAPPHAPTSNAVRASSAHGALGRAPPGRIDVLMSVLIRRPSLLGSVSGRSGPTHRHYSVIAAARERDDELA